MKCSALLGAFLSSVFLMSALQAEEVPAVLDIPTLEKDFVAAINGFDKAKIIDQFGEPAKADDVKVKNTGKIVASIWQYHYINTAADGSYYATTELDFIDNKVVQVVFINNDGSEGADTVKKYDLLSKPE